MSAEDFRDLSEIDAVRLVANTAVVARESGHRVNINVAKLNGTIGLVIWMPGYELLNGQIVKSGPMAEMVRDAETAAEVVANEAEAGGN